MKKTALAAVILMALFAAFTSTASASSKQIWHLPNLDAAASEVAGVPLRVDTSDNDTEWNNYVSEPGVLGFTCITCSPSDVLYNGYDGHYYNVYRTVWLAPEVFRIFQNLSQYGFSSSTNWYDAGMAFLTLDHEGMHWRLYSGDEARVNACALKDLPRFATTDMGIPATVQQTVSVPQAYRVKVRYRALVHGRHVWRYRYVTRTRYVSQDQTVTNPIINNIVSGAQAFYRDQPYPYNAGTC